MNKTLTFFLNETEQQVVPEGTSLSQWLASKGYTAAFAVMCNGKHISHALHATTLLQENDHITLIEPMQGG